MGSAEGGPRGQGPRAGRAKDRSAEDDNSTASAWSTPNAEMHCKRRTTWHNSRQTAQLATQQKPNGTANGMASTERERHNKRRAERHAKRSGTVSTERTGEEMDSKD